MKNPRYFTAGVPWLCRPGRAYSASRWTGATSSHQYQGETPIPRETSYAPKIVPRWSLPAMTNARSTPGSGFSTTVWRLVSHLPVIPEAFSLPAEIRPSISGLRPMVPTRTISRLPRGGAFRASKGRTPVTRSMSSRRSPATRTTPSWSSSLTTTGAARPALTRGRHRTGA